MKRSHKYGFIASLSCLAVAVLLLPVINNRSWPPRDEIEVLANPILVQSWNEQGILLQNGSRVQLTGFKSLPRESFALEAATERGVELNSDGRVVGLVKVWHWCGNDPVRKHVARVDLAKLLAFLGEGETFRPVKRAKETTTFDANSYDSEFGWNISDYLTFKYSHEAEAEPRTP